MTLGSAQRYFSLAELTPGQGDSGGYSEPEEVRRTEGKSVRVIERGVFLGWSVICRDEGMWYHSRVTSLRGETARLSTETADKEDQNNVISLVSQTPCMSRKAHIAHHCNHIHRKTHCSFTLLLTDTQKPSDMLKDHVGMEPLCSAGDLRECFCSFD